MPHTRGGRIRPEKQTKRLSARPFLWEHESSHKEERGGGEVDPALSGCWKASGGTRWMAERGSKAEASPGLVGRMKAGEDV